MRFLDRIFGNSQPLKECPRCLGKGHVDHEDIKRLKQELKWIPGICAYCNGSGKIDPKTETKVPVDASYLVINIPEMERNKILKGDREAIRQAKYLNEHIEAFISRIYGLHTDRGLTPEQIADLLLARDGSASKSEDRNELLEFIQKVIDQRTHG